MPSFDSEETEQNGPTRRHNRGRIQTGSSSTEDRGDQRSRSQVARRA